MVGSGLRERPDSSIPQWIQEPQQIGRGKGAPGPGDIVI